MIGQVLRLAELGVGAFLLAALSVELGRRPIILVYALLSVHFWELVAGVPSFRLAGIGVSPVDAVNTIAFGAAFIRMRRPRGLQWLLLGVTFLILLAVVRAVFTFGVGEALLGFRAELYFMVPALLASTLTPEQLPRALQAVWRFGLVTAGLAAARWLAQPLGYDLGYAPDPSGYEIPRIINAGSAFGVATAAVFGVWRWINREATTWRLTWTSLGLLGVVLFAQHRSVWVATAVMLVLVFAFSNMQLRKRVLLVVALLSLVVGIEAFGLGAESEAAESLAYAASNSGTWEWRVQRWQDVWQTHSARGLGAVVFGSGYGYSWVSGAVGLWEASPHNGYIQIAVRVGLVGALMLFGTYLRVIGRLGRSRRSVSKMLLIAAVGVLVYFVPYSGNAFSGLLLGLAVAHYSHLSLAEARSAAHMSSGAVFTSGARLPR